MPQMWQYVLDEIFQAIKMEPEPEMLANVFESFVKVSPINNIVTIDNLFRNVICCDLLTFAGHLSSFSLFSLFYSALNR